MHDYSRKTGIIHSEILLPENAPIEYKERGILWNAVERNEKNKNAQLAREVEIALPVELDRAEQIRIVREFINENFISKGMCADIAIHEKHGKKHENPHAHIMLTMRPIQENGEFAPKSKKEYILDENGNKQYDSIKRTYKCRKIRTTDWDSNEFLHNYRQSWADKINAELEKKGISSKLSPLSYEKQGIKQTPTIHLGHASHALEKRGIETIRGNRNREIQKLNQIKIKLSDPLQKIFESGTQQEAIEHIANIRNQYILQTNLSIKVKSKKEEIENKLLPNAQNSILSMVKELKHIEGLSNQRTQIRANKAELKPWQLFKINNLTNQSLALKDKIANETQKFTNKWGVIPDKASEKIKKLRQSVSSMESNLKKIPQIHIKINEKIESLKVQFRKDLLLIMAEYNIQKEKQILYPTPKNKEKKPLEQRLKEIEATKELNDFTYDEVKDNYTPEQQEKVYSFLKKRNEQIEIQKKQKSHSHEQEYEHDER